MNIHTGDRLILDYLYGGEILSQTDEGLLLPISRVRQYRSLLFVFTIIFILVSYRGRAQRLR